MLFYLLLENGLYKAQQSSKLLYGNDINVLTKMNAIDICQTFEGAPIINLELVPGKNILDLALDAECFSTHSKYINNYIFIFKKSR